MPSPRRAVAATAAVLLTPLLVAPLTGPVASAGAAPGAAPLASSIAVPGSGPRPAPSTPRGQRPAARRPVPGVHLARGPRRGRRGQKNGTHAAAAAVATAAHDVLAEYFPASKVKLDADLAASLAMVPDGKKQDAG